MKASCRVEVGPSPGFIWGAGRVRVAVLPWPSALDYAWVQLCSFAGRRKAMRRAAVRLLNHLEQ